MKNSFVQLLKGAAAVVLAVCAAGCGAGHQNYTQMGVDALAHQDMEKAMQYFEKAISQDPANINNYFIVGKIYDRLKLYQRAIYVYAAATRADPNNADAYFLLGMSCLNKPDMERAVKAFQKAQDLYMLQDNREGYGHCRAVLHSLQKGLIKV